ncbi:o-succinylbenzoate synthase [Alginatibacterium sediminis]|uniref:o-succinylbenzoate synthase n=1 Tax=Alginatibacterium sediminis TaxID=2164068 RepID=A0A420E6R3_9ALTE|nr:o-succinylbenzoate synthase [Alginatibacterium sediminis]RKF14317.1 o-succinylbenzoate synthase [Alginatibacterium sediminis]
MPNAEPRLRLQTYRIAFKQAMRFGPYLITERRGYYLSIRLESGRLLIAEAAPLPGFSQETQAQCLNQLLTLTSKSVDQLLTLDNKDLYPSVSFALSCLQAQFADNALLRDCALSLELANKQTQFVGDGQALVMGSNSQVLNQLEALHSAQSVKLKLGRQSIALERQLLRDINQHFPHLRLRLDANQNYSLEQALDLFEGIDSQAIDYCEEPLANPSQLPKFYQNTGIHFALDESTRQPDFVFSALAGLRCLVLKPSLFGPITKLQHCIKHAASHQVSSVLSSSYESPLGILILRELARQLTPEQAPGLDTLTSFEPGSLRLEQL